MKNYRIIFNALSIALLYSCSNNLKINEENINNNQSNSLAPSDSAAGSKYSMHIVSITKEEYQSAADKSNTNLSSFCEQPSYGKCVDAFIEMQLIKDSLLVKEQDSTMILKMENGDTLSLVSSVNAEAENIQYNYFGHLESIHSYGLLVYYYEGSSFSLVNTKTKKIQWLGGPPLITPVNKHVIVFNCDIEAAYDFNGIQLFSYMEDSVHKECELMPERWGPAKPKCINDSTIYFIKLSMGEKGFIEEYAKLVIEERGK